VTTALVVTHTASEHPGLLGTWLHEVGLGLEVVEPWRGDELPPSLDGFAALVVMGGPQQAYDDGSAPWLRATKELMRTAVAQRLPTLGVCLGAQLLAEATGGRVQPGEAGPELGAKLVAKRDVAAADPLPYDEPPIWFYPIRESLGGALLAAGRAADAERVFRDDLQKHPRNARSLFGLEAALARQGKDADAAWVQREFDRAWANADIKLSLGDL